MHFYCFGLQLAILHKTDPNKNKKCFKYRKIRFSFSSFYKIQEKNLVQSDAPLFFSKNNGDGGDNKLNNEIKTNFTHLIIMISKWNK